jgi:hypothetical protein
MGIGRRGPGPLEEDEPVVYDICRNLPAVRHGFDVFYYESDTYLSARDVGEGLKRGCSQDRRQYRLSSAE